MRRIDVYQVERGDNLGDPTFWNSRFTDIDLRIAANEDALLQVDQVADAVEQVALDRINQSITPLVVAARESLASIPDLFEATSGSTATLGTGTKTFTVDAANRALWVVTFGVLAASIDDPSKWMSGTLVSFDRETGELVLSIDDYEGSGSVTGWSFSIGGRRGLRGQTGPAGLTPRGAYSSGTAYVAGDAVLDQGGTWVNVLACTGVAPPTLPTQSNTNWQLVAQPGADGDVSESDLNTALATKANLSHSHAISDVTGLQTALDGKAATLHSHAIADVTGLQTALNGKETANAALIKSNVSAGLTAGYTATAADDGTWSTGSYKPAPATGNLRRIVNAGAFSFVAPTADGDYTVIVKVTNGSGAGAVTWSGFAKVSGDTIGTTNGHKFLVYITKLAGDVAAIVQALQ